MKRITSEIPAPTMAVYLEGGKTPLLSAKEFESIGFSIVAYAASSVYASAFAMYEVFKEIILGGHTVNSQMRMIPFSDFNEMLGLSKIRKLEKKYS
jgi:methylisocitrate lyase